MAQHNIPRNAGTPSPSGSRTPVVNGPRLPPMPAPEATPNPPSAQMPQRAMESLKQAEAAVQRLRSNMVSGAGQGRMPLAPSTLGTSFASGPLGGHHDDKVAAEKRKHLHARLGDPPQSYEDEAQYRIRVSRAVRVSDTHYLRPSDIDTIVTGAFATTIADDIVSAEKLPNGSTL